MTMSRQRQAVTVVGCVIASVALMTGCSSSSSTSDATSASASASASVSASKSLTPEQIAYCKAVTTWGSSTAAANVKAAVESKDPAKVKAAMTAYVPETQAMLDAVPADASASVKKAYQDLLAAVTASGNGTLTALQSTALSLANPIIAKYYGSVCN